MPPPTPANKPIPRDSRDSSLLTRLLTLSIAAVWLINGLFCKVLTLVPRHREIVARILGDAHSLLLTRTIGLLETGMAVWIISGIKPRFCALAQIVIIATMNIIEFVLAPDLLLFGRINIIIACIFIAVIFYNDHLKKSSLRSRSIL